MGQLVAGDVDFQQPGAREKGVRVPQEQQQYLKISL